MSKRVSNKPHGGGARSGRVRLGHWRLQRAQLRAERAKKERDAMRVANQMAVAKPKPKGFLHSVVNSFKKLRNQGRQRHAGGSHG